MWYCWRKGYSPARCPELGKGEWLQCRKCKEWGHREKQCPEHAIRSLEEPEEEEQDESREKTEFALCLHEDSINDITEEECEGGELSEINGD